MKLRTASTAPSFRFDLTVWVLRRRAKNDIDRFDDSSYGRTLTLGDAQVELTMLWPGVHP